MKPMKTAKKLHSIAVLMLLSTLPAIAQNAVYYSYDAAGNRVRREIVLNQQNAPQQPGPTAYYTDRLSADYRIKIHPNASDGIVRIEVLSTGGRCEGAVTTFNASGMKVTDSKVEDGNAYVNLGDSPKGVYILHVDIGGKTTDWKIIKK